MLALVHGKGKTWSERRKASAVRLSSSSEWARSREREPTLVPPGQRKAGDAAERNSEEEVRELRLATQVSHPMCELTAKGLRGPAQLGGDRASPRGEWASFPYVAGAGSRMGRPVAVP